MKRTRRIWIKRERDISVDELIRFRPECPSDPPKDWDGYIYGIASGGFGLRCKAIGSSIFVKNESWSIPETLGGKGVDARWDRSFDIEVCKTPFIKRSSANTESND